MRELLAHKYECANPKDYKDFVNSCKAKDWKGNNVFHEIFMLDEEMRNKYLAVIYDPAYHVKAFLRPQPKRRCCGLLAAKNQVIEIIAPNEEREPDAVVQIGDFWKRNRISLQPYEMEHRQPLNVTEEIRGHSKEITELLIQSFEADYVIVTTEEWPGDQRSNIVEN